jgi:tRNA(fMet)-specific endonuclease VapC
VTAAYLLDTNVVTAVLRSDPGVVARLRDIVNANDRVLFSAAVYYEIKRGLLKRDALRRLARFEELVRHWEWLDVERHHWEAAAVLWAQCQKEGIATTDVDLLLAVQSSHAGAILVTHDNDFERFNIECEDWFAS